MKADRAQPGNTDQYIAGFYASTDRLVAALEKELAPYEVSKGTIRFPLGIRFLVKLIERIARFRAMEVVEKHELRPRRTVKQR